MLVTAGDWSRPDGKSIVYSESNRETGWDLWLLDVNAKDRKPQPLLVTKSNEFEPQFSPDGRWLAYSSDESGSLEVYVTNFPPTPGRKQVSVGGGKKSRWSRDGRELFYYNTGQSKIMSVTVQAGASFECSAPKSVISALLPSIPGWGYRPTPDGKGFVLIEELPNRTSDGFSAITNWPALLKKPRGKE